MTTAVKAPAYTREQLEAMLAATVAAEQENVANIARPLVENVLTRKPCAPSRNGKPWVGTVDSFQITVDGVAYRAQVTITDIAQSAELKKA